MFDSNVFYHAMPGMFILSAVLSYGYILYARQKNWLDVPNQRSSHTVTTPRGGGIVFIGLWLIMAISAIFFRVISLRQGLIFIPGTFIIACVGFYDDRRSLSAKYRAIAYFIAAAISVYVMQGFPFLKLGALWVIPLSWVGWVIALFAIVWSVNLFNFMDGTDGLAATEALWVLGIGGGFLWHFHGYGLAIMAWLLACAIAGFLLWNLPRAKLFMGDVGSASLGFIIMVLALYGENQYAVPAVLWGILYGSFLFDATLTFLRRLIAGETWYNAHHSHAYQRLHQLGWSHRKILVAMNGVNLLLGILAIIGFYSQQLIIVVLIAAIVLLTTCYYLVERAKPMYPLAKN